MKKIADLHFLNHIIVVVDGFAVQPQSDQHTCLEHVKCRGDAVSDAQITRRMMGDRRTGFGEQFDIVFRRPDTMPDDNAFAEKSDIVHVPHQRFAEKFKAVNFLEYRLDGMNMNRRV